jgi:hypothetical protein
MGTYAIFSKGIISEGRKKVAVRVAQPLKRDNRDIP